MVAWDHVQARVSVHVQVHVEDIVILHAREDVRVTVLQPVLVDAKYVVMHIAVNRSILIL